MSQRSDPNKRDEGMDRRSLDEDVRAEAREKLVCPRCGLGLEPGAIRCPRCNAFVLTSCGGSCASCGSLSCAQRERL